MRVYRLLPAVAWKITDLGTSTAKVCRRLTASLPEQRVATLCCADRLSRSRRPTPVTLANPWYNKFGCFTELLVRHLVDTFRTAFFLKLKDHLVGQIKPVGGPDTVHRPGV